MKGAKGFIPKTTPECCAKHFDKHNRMAALKLLEWQYFYCNLGGTVELMLHPIFMSGMRHVFLYNERNDYI